MDEAGGLGLWARRALYLGVSLALVLAALVPMGGGARPVPPPEPLLALTLAWVARRPREAPALSIALVFLAADLLLMRPPGLRAAAVLIACEWLRAHPARDADPLAEWARAGAAILAVVLIEQGARALTLSDALAGGPSPGPALAQAGLSVIAYPLVAVLAHGILGLRRPRPRGARERAGRAAPGRRERRAA